MGGEIFTSICEAKAIRDSEFALGRKESIDITLRDYTNIKKAFVSLMSTVSSFLF